METHINEGAYLRCGAKWKCESEAPSKVFFQCEKWKGQQRFIGIIEVDGEIPGTTRQITNQPEIEATIRTFYENLYRERPTSSSEDDIKEFMGDTAYDQFSKIYQRNIPTYTQEKLARDLDSEEVLFAIHNGKHGVAPGISGFSREFYKVLSKDLIGFIMKYIIFSEKQGILSSNQRIGVITLLPKGIKDKKALKNWRPITLLSTLYKIISGVIANRFKVALHGKLISNKVDAYADDVNLTLPRKESSIREVVRTLDRFEKISGLRVNKEKTQMLRIGKDAMSDPILCEDLGLQWVNRLSILGIKLSAKPDEIL